MFRLDITKNVFTGRVVKHWHGLCRNHFLWRCSGNYQIQDLAQWSSCSVIGQMLNSVILEVFSNIYESIILCLRQLRSEKMKCWHILLTFLHILWQEAAIYLDCLSYHMPFSSSFLLPVKWVQPHYHSRRYPESKYLKWGLQWRFPSPYLFVFDDFDKAMSIDNINRQCQ